MRTVYRFRYCLAEHDTNHFLVDDDVAIERKAERGYMNARSVGCSVERRRWEDVIEVKTGQMLFLWIHSVQANRVGSCHVDNVII